MQKVVVTGGAGFIGSHIVEALTQQDLEIIIYDKRPDTGNIQPLLDKHPVRHIQADIMDKKKLTEVCQGATKIFHLAALTSVPGSMEDKLTYMQVNTLGTLNVLEAAKENSIRNVVFSSSAAVYGDNPIQPKVETLLPEPKSPYALSKLDGEHLNQIFNEAHNLNAVSLRYFNVFGPRQDPKSAYAAAIPLFITKALKNEDITIFGDGGQTRDFIYVKDVAKANLVANIQGQGIINVATGTTITVNKLVNKIIEITTSKSKVNYLPERPGDIKHSQADNSKMCIQLKLSEIYNLEKALEETVAYYS